jgi:peptidoglycan/LPS O-acetylase OafA/YrhL
MYAQPKRMEFLDSIRGLAALFVLLSHTAAAFAWSSNCLNILNWPFFHIMWDGKAAVAMFFVLSGYVLSKPYVGPPLDGPIRQICLPTFYLRRLTRIWLPWFGVFMLSIAAKEYLFRLPATQPPISSWLGQFWHAPLLWGDFFRQCLFALHDSTRELLNQDWSLGVELKGSVLIPVFIFISSWRRLWLLFLAVILLLGMAVRGHFYVSFIFGVLIARYGDKLGRRFQGSGRPLKFLLLLFSLSLYQVYSWSVGRFGPAPAAEKYGWVATALGCCGILMLTLNSRTIQRLLDYQPVVFLGRISYSIYLVQFIIILCVLPHFLRLLNGLGMVYQPALFGLVILASISVTIIFSAITYRYIEVPAIDLGHWLTKKIQSRLKT